MRTYKASLESYLISVCSIAVSSLIFGWVYFSMSKNMDNVSAKLMAELFFISVVSILTLIFVVRRLLYKLKVNLHGNIYYFEEKILFKTVYSCKEITQLKLVKFSHGGILPYLKVNEFTFGEFLSDKVKKQIIIEIQTHVKKNNQSIMYDYVYTDNL